MLTKVGLATVTLFLSSVVVFWGMRQLPGDPAIAMAGEDATPERLDAIRSDLGLHEPVLVQYVQFIRNFLTGSWGTSTRSGEEVRHMVASSLPVTLQLAVYAIAVAIVFGILLGVVAERYRTRWPELLSNGVALLALSVPSFWLGLLAILLFAVNLGWFPASGYDGSSPWAILTHLTLPALVLSTAFAATIGRQTRASLITTMRSDYVRTARAKGLGGRRVLAAYGLRNSLIVVVTVVGLQLGTLISGAVVTEQVFGLPGFGKLVLSAVLTRDYPVVQTVVLITTVTFVVINLVVDMCYTLIDPKVRVGGAT
ncbi:ABC transporter permease [Nocardioides houyundeii]|uniref:ABC transporter permease n=1 Tax=Nocardioides houyundeii TaxID=2045452 RepID=UPI001F07A91A|nr:ABC transporter permease [Nocardioides houyundeii]